MGESRERDSLLPPTLSTSLPGVRPVVPGMGEAMERAALAPARPSGQAPHSPCQEELESSQAPGSAESSCLGSRGPEGFLLVSAGELGRQFGGEEVGVQDMLTQSLGLPELAHPSPQLKTEKSYKPHLCPTVTNS